MSWLLAGYRLLWSGNVSVPPDFLGLNIQGWPNGYPSDVAEPSFKYSWYRVWDHKTADNKYLTWAAIHTGLNTFSWGQMDAVMNVVATRGLKVHYTLQSTPTHLARVALQGTNDAYGYPGGASECTDLSQLSDFITRLVRRYRGQIGRIGVRNEPDYSIGNTFYAGSAAQNAAEARAVNLAALAEDSTIQIISPADWSSGVNSWLPFLQASDGAGGTGRNWVHALSWHPYYRFWHTDKYWEATPAYNIREFFRAARLQLATIGMPSEFPIVCDEIGYASDRFDVNLNASTTAELIAWFKRICIGHATLGIRSMYPYCYDTINSGNALQNPSVAIAWNDMFRALSGRVLRAVYFNPSTGAYRIEYANGDSSVV